MSLKIFCDPDNVLQTPVQLPAKSPHSDTSGAGLSILTRNLRKEIKRNSIQARHQMVTMTHDWAYIGDNLVIVHDNFTGIVFLLSSVNKADKAGATF